MQLYSNQKKLISIFLLQRLNQTTCIRKVVCRNPVRNVMSWPPVSSCTLHGTCILMSVPSKLPAWSSLSLVCLTSGRESKSKTRKSRNCRDIAQVSGPCLDMSLKQAFVPSLLFQFLLSVLLCPAITLKPFVKASS